MIQGDVPGRSVIVTRYDGKYIFDTGNISSVNDRDWWNIKQTARRLTAYLYSKPQLQNKIEKVVRNILSVKEPL